MKKYLFIDCDPGVDDCAAIILASKLKDYEIVGISTLSGNVRYERTYDNARKLLEFIGLDTAVYMGAKKPLIREIVTAEHIHGEDGLGGVKLPDATSDKNDKKAWDALYEALCKYGENLSVIAIGPLTNIAIGILKYPDFEEKLKNLIIMGGSLYGGNVTASAEFNIYVDPEAAKRVFDSNIHIIMFGLDVTLKAYMTSKDLEKIRAIGTKEAVFLADCFKIALDFSRKYGLKGVAVHDACTIMYLFYPELFSMKRAGVTVETISDITRGKTVSDMYSDKKMENRNVDVVLDVDREKFVEYFIKIIKGQ